MTIFENLIFDLDGTIIDSEADIKNSLKQAFQVIYGKDINVSSIRIGQPLEKMLHSLCVNMPEEEINNLILRFRDIYKNSGFPKTVCYDGIKDLLMSLSLKGKKIFIATNKPGCLTQRILNNLEIQIFNDVCSVDTNNDHLSKKDMIKLLIRKNNLEKERSLMIGDSDSDIKAAHENSIFSAGIGYGYGERAEIMNMNPDYFFETVDQLAQFLIPN